MWKAVTKGQILQTEEVASGSEETIRDKVGRCSRCKGGIGNALACCIALCRPRVFMMGVVHTLRLVFIDTEPTIYSCIIANALKEYVEIEVFVRHVSAKSVGDRWYGFRRSKWNVVAFVNYFITVLILVDKITDTGCGS